MIEKVKEFVSKKFNGNVAHFERTVYWLEELKPNCDEDMQIAGYAHDIERAYNRHPLDYWKNKKFDDPYI